MSKSAYSLYKPKADKKKKINSNIDLYQKLPNKKYDVIYMDPPWDYNNKLQYDKTSLKKFNNKFEKEIFISSASFHYPTLKLKELKLLDVNSISSDNCLLFMWTTGPHLSQSIELGKSWGFNYKTMAFVWEKENHNPGHYTLSSVEFCLVFKRGKIPSPRGARNMRQFLSQKRKKHSVKPIDIIKRITNMFPKQNKIELFSRKKYPGWDSWGLDI